MKRVILIILGVLVLLMSLPLLIGGAVFTAMGSGEDPTVEGRIGQVDSTGYAVVSDALDVDWDFPFAERFDILVGARSAGADTATFIGYGPAASVDSYLSGVPQTLVHSIGDATRTDREVEIPGSAVPEPPGDQDFWLEQASGTGLQEIPLVSQTGSFRLVVMNADASRAVDVDVFGSMSLPFLLPVGIGMLIVGLLLLALGIALLVWGIRSKPAPTPQPAGYPYGQPPAPGFPPQHPGGSPYGPTPPPSSAPDAARPYPYGSPAPAEPSGDTHPGPGTDGAPAEPPAPDR